MTGTAVLQACCTRAMLRHAYIAQGHFGFGKAPSESTSRRPNALVWHLLCAVQETKGYKSGGPRSIQRGGYFGGCNFTTGISNVSLEAGLSQVLLARRHVAGSMGLLHSHKTPRTSSRSSGMVQTCGPSVADPWGSL